jgi:hypothetical protein
VVSGGSVGGGGKIALAPTLVALLNGLSPFRITELEHSGASLAQSRKSPASSDEVDFLA